MHFISVGQNIFRLDDGLGHFIRHAGTLSVFSIIQRDDEIHKIKTSKEAVLLFPIIQVVY